MADPDLELSWGPGFDLLTLLAFSLLSLLVFLPKIRSGPSPRSATVDPALLRKQLYIGTMAFCRGYVIMLGCKGNLTNDQRRS